MLYACVGVLRGFQGAMTMSSSSRKDIPDVSCETGGWYDTGSLCITVTGGLWRVVSA